jgi:nucleotide-binding universal stress UspA family protein
MKLLVAIDTSPNGDAIINHVARRPWPHGTSVCVLNVIDSGALNSDFVDVAAFAESQSEAALDMVKSAARRLAASGLDAKGEIIDGYPRTGIIEVARQWPSDLIILGSQGYQSLASFLLGSVAANVLRNAPCSVEIVRPSDDCNRILVATDGSAYSIAAVRSIATRPWSEGCQFKVISVVDRAFPEAAWFFNQQVMERIEERMTDEAREAVSTAVEMLASAGLCAAGSVIAGDPKSKIIEEARLWEADMAIVGSHGRRGFDRALQGSVSEAVAMHAPCSVEVIR